MGKHFVPKGYLKEWCDPNTPQGAYLWVFEKDGSGEGKKRAPKVIFNEEDMYDFLDEKSGEKISYEGALKELEDCFYEIRDKKIAVGLSLNEEEKQDLFLFVAATHVRTVAQRELLKEFYQDVKEMTDWFIENTRGATPEQLKPYKSLTSERATPIDYEELKDNAHNPHKRLLPISIKQEFENFIKFKMQIGVLETEEETGFITSDNPCMWIDPEAWRRPPLQQGPGLIYPAIEIRLPISPKQMILMCRVDIPRYSRISNSLVDEINRTTRFYSDKEFVVHKNVKKGIWFDPGTPPPDYPKIDLPPPEKK